MGIDQFERKNHKTEKNILIGMIVFSIMMIGILGYFEYLELKNRPLIDYPRYTISTMDWTSENVRISIQDEDGKISSYSFDGGKNYQESNTYEVLTNGEFLIRVKDIHGKESQVVSISIHNIDKDSPIITFETVTTVQIGSNFSLRNGVTAYDELSGLNSSYVVVPNNIDTSIPGEYIVTYTAFDKVGNYTEKQRKIIVMDIQGKTYYRYRDATIENYQCEPYVCNCVVSNQAELSKTCPSGYTFNEPNKCCQTCYKTCKRTIWGEWSEWSQNKVTASSTREVETKVE